MMFSQTDLKYIELEMLYSILSDDTPYPWNPAEPAAANYFDSIETPDDFCDLLKNSESQWLQLLRQLESHWEDESFNLSKSITD
ncbi:hypothetical protein D0962_19265 [Leptolyngbyaceae cyanobacterium CCMR0082]|uniref:Uncharacterized protein n=2 Tax=Adonisia turfae TaxID=2950184 RepID=A0A6M0S8Z6_9CYAN|nr:hypothetical protein [Adonisia turfae]NEZ57434.1 hypothetical protein [Adonisia turfae CCMR0081]NEZ64899.1 hypothetical protein [Adonisia turfae CCMR0082]